MRKADRGAGMEMGNEKSVKKRHSDKRITFGEAVRVIIMAGLIYAMLSSL